MRAPLSWLQHYAQIPSDIKAVADRFGACGFAVDAIEGEVIDLDVTANRPDCLSIYGLAREAATAFDVSLALPPGSNQTASSGDAAIAVAIEAPGCGRYALAVVDVTVGPSPAWLASRLVAAGLRPINNIVDITNYVMLEMGQPMHAFDAARLAGAEIHVRLARSGEQMTSLDGETRKLEPTMLVIADRDRAVAIAGVIGGHSSEVSGATTRIALESASFVPADIRATSRALGLKTEASARFERGADPMAPVTAIHRALELLQEVGAGRLVGSVTDVQASTFREHAVRPAVTLRRGRIAQVLGEAVPDSEIERVLERLGFSLSPASGGWLVSVPTFRVDVTREADLIEEVGRHWGLDRIRPTFPALTSMPRPSSPGIARGRRARRVLTGAGLQESVTFTFIEAAAAARFAGASDQVVIKNPLTEKFAVLRPSIVPGLLESLAYNRNRQADDVRLFEVGTVFSRSRGERSCAGWVLSGSRASHWSQQGAALSFTDTKGIAELLGTAFRAPLDVGLADDLPWLVRGQRASLLIGDTRIGWMGQMAGTPAGEAPVFTGEVDLDALDRMSGSVPSAIAPLPRFPAAVRDISVLIAETLPAASVRGTIRSNAPATLAAVREFDRYQGKGVPDGHISLSLRLTFRDPQRTLTDSELQDAVDRVVAALEREHHATLRGK